MGTWKLASADNIVALDLNVSDDGPLNGTLTYEGRMYPVTGAWAASDSVLGRNASAFSLSGRTQDLPDVPNFIAASGIMAGSGTDPTRIDIRVGVTSSSDETLNNYSGVLIPQPSMVAAAPSVSALASLQGNDSEEATIIMSHRPSALRAQVQLPSGLTIPIQTEEVIVGRGVAPADETAAIDLSSEQEKATVSRIHAQITRVDDHYEIEDRHSSNQTRLNNEILVPRLRYRLRNGDIIVFGKVRCVYIQK